jgi:hypothetical protein
MASMLFKEISGAALLAGPALIRRWLPEGRRQGTEWVARNPRRQDCAIGTFKVNLRTGKWADFATGDKGGDAISLAAFRWDVSQGEAARRLARELERR